VGAARSETREMSRSGSTVVAHVSARPETSHDGLPLWRVGISKVSKGACECGMLEEAGEGAAQPRWKSAARGVAHVFVRREILNTSCPPP
jgi:hypothetical protein